ncbi:MAG: ABC transporter permease [Bacilli bacterium]|nr:ABC transporter permease [Bacilli bacterium]
MRLFQLIRCEFIKNFSIKRLIITSIVLSLCCFGLIKFEEFYGGGKEITEPLSINQFHKEYEDAKKKYSKLDRVIVDGLFESYDEVKPVYERTYQLIGDTDNLVWQNRSLHSFAYYTAQYKALKQLKENYQNPLIKNYLEEEKIEDEYYGISHSVEPYYFSTLKRFYDKSIEEIDRELLFLEKNVSLLKESLQQNAYYLSEKFAYNYLIFESEKRALPMDKPVVERYQYIIQNKIMDENDFRAVNAREYQSLFYARDSSGISTLEDGYVNMNFYYQTMRKERSKQKKITKYSMDHGLKHDLYLKGDNIDDFYLSSKNFMNLGLHLGLVIMFLSAIYHAGIVAKEHDKGTVKLLLTKPIKRKTILLSKILYLIFDTYLLWILGSFIMFLIVGFYSGFGDLFTSKLVICHDKVVEINYWLWYFKELFICGIPICCFQVILFGLSALTLSTSFTASIVSILTVFSFMIWFLISQLGLTFLSFLSYTPIPYLDYWMIRYNSRYYLESIVRENLFSNYGIVISLVVAVGCALITIFVYEKRDIKN